MRPAWSDCPPACPAAQGTCYVETSNLDGETNLKIRKAPDATRACQTAERLASLRGSIEYDAPNNRLYVFEGTLTVDGGGGATAAAAASSAAATAGSRVKVPIGVDATVLRGSVLRNTPYCVGLVLYAGPLRQSGLLPGPHLATTGSCGCIGRLEAALRTRERRPSVSDPTERPWRI